MSMSLKQSLYIWISFSLCSQRTSYFSAPPRVQLNVTASPSLTDDETTCLRTLGARGPDGAIPLTPFVFLFSMGIIVTLELVSTLPFELVALQVYLPPSSGNASLIMTDATPFLYLTSMISLEAICLPSLRLCSGLRPVMKEGGTMRESSGRRANSLV